MFGLKTIISAAIPVLMLLYPLTIVIILLALLHNVFGGRRCVYAWTMAFTMISALMTGLETAGIAPVALEQLFTQYIPSGCWYGLGDLCGIRLRCRSYP